MVRSLFGPTRRSYLDISHIQLGSDEVKALCTRVDPPDPPRGYETGSATVWQFITMFHMRIALNGKQE
jgi:hypothetical protein